MISSGGAAAPRWRASGCRSCWPTREKYRKQSDLVASLRDEIMAVITRHINVDPDQVQVTMERGDTVSTLEIDVEVPHAVIALVAAR